MISPLKNGILKVLGYFDLFNFPINSGEIFRFLNARADVQELSTNLDELAGMGCIFRFGEYYSLQNNPELLKNRIQGTVRAEKLLKRGRKISRLLYCFPFVRGIFISGSLSKRYADENADIDYFIITEANRLWVARTLMHFLKKISFLTGHEHMLCMNYYIDEEALLIEERNVFTATEMATLLPVQGNGSIHRFFSNNAWVRNYFPNQSASNSDSGAADHNALIKKGFEFVLRNRLGDWLDNYFMRITSKRWKLKELRQKRNYKGELMGLKTAKHYSKPNPELFQKKILHSLENKYDFLSQKWSKILGEQHSQILSEGNNIVISNPVPGPMIS
ncbi:MAG: hypothetical protein ACHQEM_00970 [Chitinophagales bacterium]